MNDHFGDAMRAIEAATTQADLNATYSAHITRLIFNGATREELQMLAQAWQARSLQLLDEAMDGDQP